MVERFAAPASGSFHQPTITLDKAVDPILPAMRAFPVPPSPEGLERLDLLAERDDVAKHRQRRPHRFIDHDPSLALAIVAELDLSN